MATFTFVPSYSTSIGQQPKIIEAKFGDGYEQAIFNGINYTPKVWDLQFNNISAASAQSIINFFITNNTATTPFDWTDPESVAGKYKCKEWKQTYNAYEARSLTCKFEEVFWG